ncbi:hypothetical protein CQJ94_20735 [Glycomyces fuscus]|nr:hypothetical protein CQJ94_20735 [Glycomyces fuscus]
MITAAVLLTLFLVGTPIALYAETRRVAARRDGGADVRAGLWRAAVRVTRFPRSYARLWWGLLAGACVVLCAREGTPASGAAGLVLLGVWGPPSGPSDGFLFRHRTGRGTGDRSASFAPVALYRRRVRVWGVAAVLAMAVLSAVLVTSTGESGWYAWAAVPLPVLGLVLWQRTVYPEVRLSGTRLLLKRYAAWVSVPVERVARVDAGNGVAVHFTDGGAFCSRAWGSTPARDEEAARRITRFVREARGRVSPSADRSLEWGRDLVAGPFWVWLGLVLAWFPV